LKSIHEPFDVVSQFANPLNIFTIVIYELG
jgi:hypothetical protein